MLDAFQQSARAEREAQARAAAAPKGKSSGKRAAEPKPAESRPKKRKSARKKPVPPPAASLPTDLESARDEILGTGPRPGFTGIPLWVPVAVVVLIAAMAGTYWIGDLLGGETRAGEPTGDPLVEDFETDLVGGGDPAPEVTEPSPVPPPEEDADLTEDDRRFLDKSRSTYTVRAIYFANDREGKARARSTYWYLRNAGLPVIAPVQKGDIVVICVGAEPTRTGELEQIRDRLHSLPGPPPESEPGAFESAYFVNIDDQVERGD